MKNKGKERTLLLVDVIWTDRPMAWPYEESQRHHWQLSKTKPNMGTRMKRPESDGECVSTVSPRRTKREQKCSKKGYYESLNGRKWCITSGEHSNILTL